jgi:phospholipid transport system substrate-binding protein
MRVRFALFLLLVLIGTGHTTNMSGGPPSTGATVIEPAVLLRQGVDRLLDFLRRNPPPEALAAFLDTEIAPFFDFHYMTRSAAPGVFDRLDPRSRALMVDRVKTSFLTRMAEKLGGYAGQQVRFLGPRSGRDGRTATVPVMVLGAGGYPSRLDFRLYDASAGGPPRWRVFDVAANGQSAIVFYRQELQREARARSFARSPSATRQMPPSARVPVPGSPYGSAQGMRR